MTDVAHFERTPPMGAVRLGASAKRTSKRKSRLAGRILLRPFALPLALILFLSTALGAFAQGALIDLDLARFAATNHVHLRNPPFEWLSVDHMVLHDVDGTVSAYAFVFAKHGSSLRSPALLKQHLQDAAAGKSDGQRRSDTLTNELATVITGAVDGSPVILRHFRGISDFWVEAATLDPADTVRRYGKALEVSHVVLVTPLDFRVIAAPEGEFSDGSGFRRARRAEPPPTAQCIDPTDKTVTSLAVLRTQHTAREARQKKRLDTLSPERRAQHEEALRTRAAALAAEWEVQRQLWQAGGTAAEGEATE